MAVGLSSPQQAAAAALDSTLAIQVEKLAKQLVKLGDSKDVQVFVGLFDPSLRTCNRPVVYETSLLHGYPERLDFSNTASGTIAFNTYYVREQHGFGLLPATLQIGLLSALMNLLIKDRRRRFPWQTITEEQEQNLRSECTWLLDSVPYRPLIDLSAHDRDS
jgi:hypothetical protein